MATDSEIRAWLVGQGEQVSVKGPLSAKRRAKYAAAHGEQPGPRRLPDPDELEDEPPEEFGPTIDITGDPPQESQAPAGPGSGASPLPGPGPDEPPKHAGREWRSKPRSSGTKPKAPRVTVGVRQDITGQIGFLLQVPGSIWQARDPLCGGTFVQQLPAIADSFTDWVVDSPSLLALFTGPGGSWIVKAVKTAAALAPVISVGMAHHVYHTIEAGEVEQPSYEQYAA